MSVGRMGARAALVAVFSAVGLLAGAGSALAETKTFKYTGEEQEFKVPAGITSVEVEAVGSEGGSARVTGAAGGLGAIVTGKLPVKPEHVLYVEVGGVPFNGGGIAIEGGKGGGASDVREASIGTEPSPGNEESLNSRLLVAAGGGGGGSGFGNCTSGAGGAAAEKGANGTNCGFKPGEGGGPGEAGKGGAGGLGYTGESPDSAANGEAGKLGIGGGRFTASFGGGGGGGLYGGGEGGEQLTEEVPRSGTIKNAGSGGGGGGSNLVPMGGSHGLAAAGQAASVKFTWTAPASALAAILVSDSTGKGPGHALADKAASIQAAVNAGQTVIACENITNYLGLVKAQTGKKLTDTQATELTTDATNLAAALGC